MCHLLQSRVQCGRHASRPQEDTGDCGNDSTTGQATATELPCMVNYMGTFIPHLSHQTEPLRSMLKQIAMFAWDEVKTRSFQEIKSLILNANSPPFITMTD